MLQREDEGWGSAFDQIHIKDNKAERHTFTLLSSPPPPRVLQSRGYNHTQGVRVRMEWIMCGQLGGKPMNGAKLLRL